MRKIIAVAITMSLFLASPMASAGVFKAIVNMGKVAMKKGRDVASGTAKTVEESSKFVNGLSTLVIAGMAIRELQAAPVEPEIREAISNGATKYQTRVCSTPEGIVEVPKYFKVCPDGSQVSYGKVVNLQ